MAIRKNNSRQADRNTIFRMHAQGFSITQIEAKLSITPAHITYVLEQYEDDLAKRKANSPELQARARIQAEVEGKVNNVQPANDPARVALKEELRREILAELTVDKPAPTPIAADKPIGDEYKHIEVPGEDEDGVPAAATRPKRRKRK